MSEQATVSTPVNEALSRVNKIVFISSASGIISIALWAILAPDNASTVIDSVVSWPPPNLGWYYFLIVTIVLAFVTFITLSRVGKTRLGPDHSRPQYSMFT